MHVFVFEKYTNLSRGSVDGAELEYVEEADASIVEKMRDRAASEVQIRVSQGGDTGHAVDTVDMRKDTLDREIPGRSCERRKRNKGQWNVPCVDGRWR